MKKLLTFLCFLMLAYIGHSQNLQRKLDSLTKLTKVGDSRQKFDALTTLSDYYSDNDLNKSMAYANASLMLSKKVKNDTFLALAYNSVANVFQYQSQLDSALHYHQKALKVRKKIKDFVGVADTYNNMGIAYDQKAQYPEALNNYFKALSFYDKKSAPEKQAMTYTNIGIVYKTQKEFVKALQYYRKAYETYNKTSDEFGKTVSAGNLGSMLILFGKYAESIRYSEIAIAGYRKNKQDRYVAYPIANIAIVYDSMKQFEKANANYLEAIKWHEFYKNGYEVAENANAYASFLIRQQKFKESIVQSLKAIDYAKKSESRLIEVQGYNNLAKAYAALGDFAKAYAFGNRYASGKDSLFDNEKTKAVFEMETKYETKKKALLLLAKDAEATKKNYIIIAISLLVFFIAFISWLIYRQQKLKNSQLEQEHKLKTAIAHIETQNMLQEQRLSISRDLHDNIGAQLTFIISSVENIKYAFDLKNTKLDDKLQNISTFTKSTILELRDTIWAMNHDAIDFEDLRARILNFVEKAKDATGTIDFNFTIDESLIGVKLTSLAGMNIYRSIQEAVNNAIKYSEADQIDIDVKKNDCKMWIQIKDNGIGFDIPSTERGNGLVNMEKRIEDIEGSFKLSSEVNKGTTITLLVNIQENMVL